MTFSEVWVENQHQFFLLCLPKIFFFGLIWFVGVSKKMKSMPASTVHVSSDGLECMIECQDSMSVRCQN